MSAAGFLLLSSVALAAPPDGPAVGSPRFARGDELVYLGEVTEAGERINNRFRKHYELEVRVFVLETRAGYTDCAILTLVRPLVDPVVAGPAASVTGAEPTRKPLPPATNLEFIRLDDRGRVVLLVPPPGPPPIPLRDSTPTRLFANLPLDSVPITELGMFVPLPPRLATIGTTWESKDPGRPPIIWTASREAIWNGGRAVEVNAVQQTDGWDRPQVAVLGWKRSDTLLVAPADGFASSMTRKIERREGANLVGWIEIKYELQPSNRYTGGRYEDVRREIEAAWSFISEVNPLLVKSPQMDPREFRVRLLKIDRFLADQPVATGFRPALESVRRQCAAAVRGEIIPSRSLPTVVTVKPGPPSAGRPAPDFVARWVHSSGQIRLSAQRGKPVVLAFFKPGSLTSEGTLAISEALHKRFADQITVIPLAISASPDVALQQRERMKLTIPIADGTDVRELYQVDTYPRMIVIDETGLFVWQFNGYGAETGYLAKEQVEKLLRKGKPGEQSDSVSVTSDKSGMTWETIRARLRLPPSEKPTYDSNSVARTGGLFR